MVPLLLFAGVISCAELCTDQGFENFARLLTVSKFGADDAEHGAFLVRHDDGSLALLWWARGSSRSVSYRGRIPRGTLAVVHSHPLNAPNPSQHDAHEARRIEMPIVVVTPAAVTVAWPDGTTGIITADRAWRRHW